MAGGLTPQPASVEPEAERKQLTVLFVDVQGSAAGCVFSTLTFSPISLWLNSGDQIPWLRSGPPMTRWQARTQRARVFECAAVKTSGRGEVGVSVSVGSAAGA